MTGKDNGKDAGGSGLLGRLTQPTDASTTEYSLHRPRPAASVERVTEATKARLRTMEGATRDFGLPSDGSPSLWRWTAAPRLSIGITGHEWVVSLQRWNIQTPVSRELAVQLVAEAMVRALPKRPDLTCWPIVREYELECLNSAALELSQVEGARLGAALRRAVRR